VIGILFYVIARHCYNDRLENANLNPGKFL